VLILNIDDRYLSNIHTLAQDLRKANVNAEVYPATMKFKKQMKYANNQGHGFVIILGENEVNDGVVTLKNMESGEQTNVATVEEIVAVIKA